jgi:hypothetical protein
MKFRPVTESECRVVQSSIGLAHQIQLKAGRLIRLLAEQFNDQTVGGVTGLTFTAVQGKHYIALVGSPIGKGRLKLRLQSDDKDVTGELILEREALDQRDRSYWEPVFGVVIPPSGGWRFGTASGGDASMGGLRDEAEETFVLGMSILYAILNGPVTA